MLNFVIMGARTPFETPASSCTVWEGLCVVYASFAGVMLAVDSDALGVH
jgi:hypothetical protein